MALYSYVCDHCGYTDEKQRPVSRMSNAVYCRACFEGSRLRSKMRRLITAPSSVWHPSATK